MDIEQAKEIISSSEIKKRLIEMNNEPVERSIESDYFNPNSKQWIHCSKKLPDRKPYTEMDALKQIMYERGYDDDD